jgi:hypothetical protein
MDNVKRRIDLTCRECGAKVFWYEPLDTDFENIEGTWAKVLKNNWLAFNDVVRSMDDSNGKVPHKAWREYILWDMQRRHDEEIGKIEEKKVH